MSAINVRENLIDRMEVEISNYLIKMTDQELGDDESHAVTELLNFVTEFERIGDYAVNIQEKAVELYEKEASFSDIAKNELKLLDSALEQILTRTNDAFENDDIALARQVAMYLAREMTSMSLVDIGEVFGGRDHTTVMHAYTRVSDDMQEKPEIYNYVTELTARLKQRGNE